MIKLCFNQPQRYAVVWRQRPQGRTYGNYTWITKASVRRLQRLTDGPLWQRTHRAAQEVFFEAMHHE